MPAGITRGLLTRIPLAGNRYSFIKEVADGPRLEKSSPHASLVIVSFTIEKVLHVSNLSPTCRGSATSRLGSPLPIPIFLMIVFLSPQGMGSSSCR